MEKNYYLIALVDYISHLEANGRNGFTEAQVIDYINIQFMEPAFVDSSKKFLDEALRSLVDIDGVKYFPDPYAGDFYARSDSSAGLRGWLSDNCPPFMAYNAVGNSAPAWLSRALRKIEETVSVPVVEAQLSVGSDDERWEPLTIDLQRHEIIDVIDRTKGVIAEIKSDNGFAAEFPAQRDSIVAHAEATIASAEMGLTTKRQVRENFIAAGKWLFEKFGSTSIGTLGSELVKLGLRLLGLIS